MALHININTDSIAPFCRKHHIQKLAFFGSVLRDDFRQDSDVDVLVEFDPEQVPGFIGLMRMQREFSEMIGRNADFRTPEDLSNRFRRQVVETSEVAYAA